MIFHDLGFELLLFFLAKLLPRAKVQLFWVNFLEKVEQKRKNSLVKCQQCNDFMLLKRNPAKFQTTKELDILQASWIVALELTNSGFILGYRLISETSMKKIVWSIIFLKWWSYSFGMFFSVTFLLISFVWFFPTLSVNHKRYGHLFEITTQKKIFRWMFDSPFRIRLYFFPTGAIWSVQGPKFGWILGGILGFLGFSKSHAP